MHFINFLWFLTAPLTIITAYFLSAYLVDKLDDKLQENLSSPQTKEEE